MDEADAAGSFEDVEDVAMVSADEQSRLGEHRVAGQQDGFSQATKSEGTESSAKKHKA